MIESFCKSKFLKRKSGIYKIICLVTKKFYIGSATNLYKRLVYGHLKSLKNNCHNNSYLQNSYNKYGINNFTFEILEFVEDFSLLRKIEQDYILNTGCWKKEIGYNIQKFIGNYNRKIITKGYKWTKERRENLRNTQSKVLGSEYIFLTLDGQIIKGKGIAQLARKHNLLKDSLLKLQSGKISHHHNWINLKNPPPTTKFINPQNIIFEIFDHEIRFFAKHYNLHLECVRCLKRGTLNRYKGWCLASSPIKRYYMISPEGKKYLLCEGDGQKFCKEMGLPIYTSRILRNDKTVKTYYGWRWEPYEKTISS